MRHFPVAPVLHSELSLVAGGEEVTIKRVYIVKFTSTAVSTSTGFPFNSVGW